MERNCLIMFKSVFYEKILLGEPIVFRGYRYDRIYIRCTDRLYLKDNDWHTFINHFNGSVRSHLESYDSMLHGTSVNQERCH